MKKIYLLFLLPSFLLLETNTSAQTIQLGAGTAVNGTTTSSPVNIWYRRTVSQFVYTAAELNAAGITGPCDLEDLGWFVTQSPFYNMPGYTVKVKHVTQNNVATALGTAGWTTVKNAFTYAPAAGGWDMLGLDQSFAWNGVDNIGVEVCWSQVQPTYSSSGQCRIYNTASGYRYSWTDAAGNSCGLAPTVVTANKPQVQMVFSCGPLSTPPCSPPVPGPSITANPNPVPCGASSELTATGSGGPYSWFDDPGGTSLIGTGPIYNTPNLFNATTYYAQEEITSSGPSVPNSLTTTFADNNGQSGNMFDVNVLQPISVESFDVHISNTATIEVYHKTGSYVGFQNNAGAWTLIATVPNVPPGGPAPLNLNLGFNLAPGTHAFYVTVNSGTGMRYTNGTALGAVYSANADLEILQGTGNAYPFSTTFSPRIWNGTIHYNSGSSSGTCLSEISSVTVNVDPASAPPAIVNPDPVVCGNSAQIEVTGSGGTINWYDDPLGNNLIFTGSIYNTPSLTNTTTYYYEEVPSGGGGPSSTTFNYTGAPQTFTVPAGVNSVNIEAWGAQGGTADSPGNNVNSGGYASGDLAVSPGDVLNIYVGGHPGGTAGGWNGGGNGFSGSNTGSGGGGASDIRVGGTALADRVIVAGGGGGHASNDGFGGAGGGLIGGDWTGWAAGGTGGTQVAGGNGGGTSGTNGQLGIGGNSGTIGTAGTGGGGGYYGGGGSGQRRGAGGGSSFIGGVTNGVTNANENQGDGLVVISYSGGGTGCASGITPITVNVIPISFTIDSFTDPTTCGGSDGTITLTGLDPNTTYDVSWNGGASVSFTSDGAGDLVITGLTEGTYTDITAEVGGCSHVESGPVVLNDGAFTFTIDSFTDPTTCGGSDGTITLTGLDPNTTYDVSWNGGASVSFTSDGAGDLVITGLTEGTYTDITAEFGGCSHVESGPVVLNDGAFTFTIDSFTDPTTCGGSDGTITLTGLDPNTTYDVSWNGGASVSFTSDVAGDLVITGLTEGTYTDITAEFGGCSHVESGPVVLNDGAFTFTIDSFTDPTICGASDGTITLTGLDPNTTYDLSWNGGASVSFTSDGAGNLVITGLTDGIYEDITAVLGGCSHIESGPVTLSGTPVSFTVSSSTPPSACTLSDGTITLSGLIPGQSYNVSWNGNVAVPITADGSGNILITGLGNGFYTNFVVSLGGCNDESFDEITFNTTIGGPTLIVPSDDTICSGDDITLTVGNPDGAVISWSGGVVDGVPFVPPLGTNTYTVTGDLAGCTTVDQVTIEVITPPNAGVLSGPSNLCVGSSGTYTSTEPGGVWSPAPASAATINPSTGLATGQNANFSPVLFIYTVSIGSCTNAEVISVVIDPLPSVPTITSNSPVCEGDDIIFEINGDPNDIITYEIDGGISQTIALDGAGNATIPPFPATLPSSTLELTLAENANCNITLPPVVETVIVNELPDLPVISSVSPVCDGDQAEFSITGNSGLIVNYELNGVSQTATIPTSGTLIVNTTASPTSEELEIISVDDGQCINTNSTIPTEVIVVNPLPATPTITNNSPICEGDLAEFTIDGVPDLEVTYTIDGGVPQTITIPPGGSFNVPPIVASLPDVTLEIIGIQDALCSATPIITPSVITVNPNPSVPTISVVSSICEGDDIIYTINGDPNNTVTYSIDGGASQTIVLDGAGEGILSPITATLPQSELELIEVENANCSIMLPPVSAVVTVDPLPQIPTVTTNDPVCEGDDAIFTIVGLPGEDVTYTINGGAPITETFPPNGEVIVIVNGVMVDQTMELTEVANNACSLNASEIGVTETIEIIGITPSVTSNSPICVADNAIFTITGKPGETVTYSIDGGPSQTVVLDINGEAVITENNALTDVTIELISVEDPLGICVNTPLNITETVIVQPILPVLSSISPVCEGDPAEFFISGDPGLTVTYTINGGAPQTATIPGSGTYAVPTVIASPPSMELVVTFLDDGVCQLTNPPIAPEVIVVNQQPVAPTINAPASICEDDFADFIITGPSGTNFTYDINGGASVSETIPGSGEIIIPANPIAVPSVILNITAYDNGVCFQTNLISQTITVNPTPNLPTVTAPSSVCEGSTINFVLTGSPGDIVTYNINGGANLNVSIPGSGTEDINIVGTLPQVELNIVGVNDGVCINNNSSNHIVIVDTLPQAPIVTTNSPVCEGDIAEFTISGSPGNTISCELNGGAPQSETFNPIGDDIVVTSTATIPNETLLITEITDGQCPNNLNLSTTINVDPLPNTPTVSNNSPICGGQNAEFNVSGDPNETISYSLNGGPTQTIQLNASGEGTILIPNAQTGQSLEITFVDNGTCQLSTSVLSEIIIDAPTPTINVSSPICEGQNAIFNIQGGPNDEITYDINGGASSLLVLDAFGNGSVTVSAVSVNQTLTISQVTNGSCTNNLNISETISVLPVPSIPNISVLSPICEGQDAIFELSGMLLGDVITFSLNGGASQQVTADANGEATVVVQSVTANQTIVLLNSSNGACNVALTESETIVVQPSPPNPTITAISPICAGDQAEFVITGAPGLEITYSINGGATQTDVIGVGGDLIVNVPNALVNQTLEISQLFDGNCSSNVNITETVMVTSATPQINAPIGVCSGDNIVFDVVGNPGDQVTYNINGGANQIQTIGASGSFAITIPSATTQQTMNIIQIANGSCINTNGTSHTVVISPPPTVPSLTSNNTVCEGQDAIFTVTGVAGESVTYALNGGASLTEIIPPTGELEIVVPAVTTNQNIVLSLIDNNGCSEVISLTELVTVIPAPNAPIVTNNSSICASDNAIFEIAGTPGNTVIYTINGGAPLNTTIGVSGTSTIQINNVNTSQVLEIIEVSDANCSLQLNITSTVVVNGATPNLSVNNNVCIGDNGVVSISGTPGDEVTYNINGGASLTVVLDVSGNAEIILPNITVSTTVNLTAVAGNGCNSSLALSETINVVPLPTMVNVNAPTSICEGQNITFEISGQPGLDVNYNLNGVQQSLTLSATGEASITDIAILPNMTFTVENVQDGSCTNANGFTTIIGVTPAPVLPSVINNGPICAGDTANFEISGLPNLIVTYTFDGGPQQTITLDANGDGVVQIPNLLTNAAFEIVQVSDGTCPNNNVVISNISVNPLPEITNISSNTPVCFGNNAEIEIQTGSNNLIVYEVNGVSQTTTANASGIANIQINAPSTSFSINIIYLEDGQCSDSVNLSHLVEVTAGDPLITSNSPICEGEDAIFEINGFAGDEITYDINGGGNQTLVLPGSGLGNITVSNPSSEVVLNISNITNGSCINNNSLSDTVSFAPLPTPIVVSNNGPICSGDTAIFTLTGEPGYEVLYNLDGIQQSINLDSTGVHIDTIINASTNISLVITEIFDGNCTRTDTLVNNISFNPTPVATFNSINNVYCDYETPSDLILTITGQGPWNITYAYNDSIISIATWSNPYNFGNSPGEYEIIAIADAFCADSSGLIAQIEILESPDSPIVDVPELFCHQSITDVVIGESSTDDLLWYSDEELTDLVGQGVSFQPADIPGITTYYVVAEENGCESEPTAFEVEIDICDISVPEGFSPNGDGINDFFVIQNLSTFPSSRLTVFNRWGGEVYHSDDYQNDWDGSSSSNMSIGGNELPEGTYYYILELGENSDFPNLSGSIQKGWVYLKP